MSERMEQVGNVVSRMSIVNKLSARIFENGAVLTCPICGRTKEKTAEEMARYMKHWPKCCNQPADVEIK